MEFDTERAKQKKLELTNLAKQSILSYWQSTGVKGESDKAKAIAAEIISQYARITPPEKESQTIGLITMQWSGQGGTGSARSVKPGNILLNIQKLITAVASGVLTVAGSIGAPWMAPFAAIVVWDSVWSGLNVSISEREAVVLWVMWKNRDLNDYVPEERLLDSVNSELEAHGRSHISQQELDTSLEVLEKLSCIEHSTSIRDQWFLREWVRINYT